MFKALLSFVYKALLFSLLLAIFGIVARNDRAPSQQTIDDRVAVFKASCDVGSIYMISNPYTNTFSYMCTNLKKN